MPRASAPLLIVLVAALGVAACGAEEDSAMLAAPSRLDTVLEWKFTDEHDAQPGWEVRVELRRDRTFRYAWRRTPNPPEFWNEIRGAWRPDPDAESQWILEPEVPRGDPGSPCPLSGRPPTVRWERKSGKGSAAADYGLWYVSAVDFEAGRFTDLVLMTRDAPSGDSSE